MTGIALIGGQHQHPVLERLKVERRVVQIFLVLIIPVGQHQHPV
jgi:hypothetical protein